MSEVIAIGTPATEHERAVIRTLRDQLPADYHVFHNVEITLGVRPYDIDLVVMAPHAYYLIDVRGETGAVGGDALQWWFEGPRFIDTPLDALARRRDMFQLLLERFEHKHGQSAALPVVPLVVFADPAARPAITDPRAADVVVTHAQLAATITDAARLPPAAGLARTLGKRAKLVRNWLRERFTPEQRIDAIGFYTVLAPLAETSTYRAYLGQHRFVGTGAEVKLKVFAGDPYAGEAERAAMMRELFRDVTAFTALGDHPAILGATEVFAWQHEQYVVVSRWRQGRYLAGLLEEPGFTPRARVSVAADLASAVAHAHAHGVLHRDINPHNVLVEPSGAASLMNFDLARVEHPRVATLIAPIDGGSARYRAPEVAQGGLHAATERTDLYALGALLYQMLTGEALTFRDGLPVYARWRPHPTGGSGNYPAVRSGRGPRVTVEEVLAKLCAEDPARRYADSRQAAADLAALRDEWG